MPSPKQQKDNKHLLDLEYVQLNVVKVLALLNKVGLVSFATGRTSADWRAPGLPIEVKSRSASA